MAWSDPMVSYFTSAPFAGVRTLRRPRTTTTLPPPPTHRPSPRPMRVGVGVGASARAPHRRAVVHAHVLPPMGGGGVSRSASQNFSRGAHPKFKTPLQLPKVEAPISLVALKREKAVLKHHPELFASPAGVAAYRPSPPRSRPAPAAAPVPVTVPAATPAAAPEARPAARPAATLEARPEAAPEARPAARPQTLGPGRVAEAAAARTPARSLRLLRTAPSASRPRTLVPAAARSLPRPPPQQQQRVSPRRLRFFSNMPKHVTLPPPRNGHSDPYLASVLPPKTARSYHPRLGTHFRLR